MATIDWVNRLAQHLNIGAEALKSSGPVLEAIGAGVQAAVEQRIGRHLEVRDHTDALNGNGKRLLFLPWDPIVSVSSLSVNGATVTVGDPLVPTYPAATVVIKGSGLMYTDGNVFPEGLGNVIVTYSAGYEEIPQALILGCVQWGALIFRNRDRFGIASVSVAGQTTSFTSDPPKSIDRMIAQFTRWGKP